MKLIIWCLPLLLIFSCSSTVSPEKGDGITNGAEESAASSCLLQYADSYDKLITLEEAAVLTGHPASAGEMKYNKVMSNTRYHEVVYTWKTDRIAKVHGFDIPDEDRLTITGICEKSLKEFKRDYSRKTEEEVAALNEQVNKQLDKHFDERSDNKTIEESKDKMKKTGVSTEQGKQTAKSVGGSLMSSLTYYTEVSGLGDASSWNSKDKNLYVLSGGVQFCVGVNKGENDEVNKALAIEAAKLILNKCK